MPTTDPHIDTSPEAVTRAYTIGLFTLPVHAAFVAVFPHLIDYEDTPDFVGAVAEGLHSDLEGGKEPDTLGALQWAAEEWFPSQYIPNSLESVAQAADPGVQAVYGWAVRRRPTP